MPENANAGLKPNFLQFISGFGVQALVHLGRMPNPQSGETRLDMPNAKYSIDLLGILQEKTKGNLTPEEDRYLADILRDLRLIYVEAANQAGKEKDKKGEASSSEEEKESQPPVQTPTA